MKAIEQYFPVMLFTVLYMQGRANLILCRDKFLTLELTQIKATEQYVYILACDAVSCEIQGGSN